MTSATALFIFPPRRKLKSAPPGIAPGKKRFVAADGGCEKFRCGATVESSRGDDLFPHLYGSLSPAKVIKVEPLPLGPDGLHIFPPLETSDTASSSFDIYGTATSWLRCLAPETAHQLTLCLLETGLFPWRTNLPDDPANLAISLWGKNFTNPIGLAAGFDKDARVVPAMERFGFGFIEVGGLTPKPWSGNPRPQMFRLHQDQALINRLGFNNKGVAAAAIRCPRCGSMVKFAGLWRSISAATKTPPIRSVITLRSLARSLRWLILR